MENLKEDKNKNKRTLPKLWKFTSDEMIELHRKAGEKKDTINNDEKIALINRVVMDRRLSAVETRVYTHLLNCNCNCTQEMIGEDLEISRITVNRSLSRLKALRYIDITISRIKEDGKLRSQAVYSILKEPGLIDSVEKLSNFIVECDLFKKTSSEESKLLVLQDEFAKFNVFKETNINQRYYTISKYSVHDGTGDSIEYSAQKKSYRILLFGAYLETKYNAKFYINDFIKFTIMEMDRYRIRVDSDIICLFINLYRHKLLEKEYSLQEALTVLNVRQPYIPNKKDNIGDKLEVAKSDFLYHCRQMLLEDEISRKYKHCYRLEEIIGLKMFNEEFDEKPSTFNLLEVLLISILFDWGIERRFKQVYKTEFHFALIALCGEEYEEILKEYFEWIKYTREYPFKERIRFI